MAEFTVVWYAPSGARVEVTIRAEDLEAAEEAGEVMFPNQQTYIIGGVVV